MQSSAYWFELPNCAKSVVSVHNPLYDALTYSGKPRLACSFWEDILYGQGRIET